jgi:hypothetical protein
MFCDLTEAAAAAHQVEVVKLNAIGVGLGGVHGHLHAVHDLRELLDDIDNDLGVPVRVYSLSASLVAGPG